MRTHVIYTPSFILEIYNFILSLEIRKKNQFCRSECVQGVHIYHTLTKLKRHLTSSLKISSCVIYYADQCLFIYSYKYLEFKNNGMTLYKSLPINIFQTLKNCKRPIKSPGYRL